MRNKKRKFQNVYFSEPYDLETLKRINPEIDPYFNQAVLDDFATKYILHRGFSTPQIKCISRAIDRGERRNLKNFVETVETVVENPQEIEKKMNQKTVKYNPADFCHSDNQEIERILKSKFRYTPKATISGIVEKDEKGNWRETCLRFGQGSKKNIHCRKQEHQFSFNGTMIRIPLPVLAYFLKEGKFISQEEVKIKISEGMDMTPYTNITSRRGIIGEVIDL